MKLNSTIIRLINIITLRKLFRNKEVLVNKVQLYPLQIYSCFNRIFLVNNLTCRHKQTSINNKIIKVNQSSHWHTMTKNWSYNRCKSHPSKNRKRRPKILKITIKRVKYHLKSSNSPSMKYKVIQFLSYKLPKHK